MRIEFTASAWEEYTAWQRLDSDTAHKINELIKDTTRNPFKGLGKPEPLKGGWKGFWSRRISHADRLVYAVEGSGDSQRVKIVMCKGHY